MSKDNPQPYKGNGQHLFEAVIDPTRSQRTGDVAQPAVSRLRVPGGWLYRCSNKLVFVPMPEVVKHKV